MKSVACISDNRFGFVRVKTLAGHTCLMYFKAFEGSLKKAASKSGAQSEGHHLFSGSLKQMRNDLAVIHA